MILKTVDLKQEYDLKWDCTLDAYLHNAHADVPQCTRPAVIVAPGGAYAYVSGRENEEVALEFFTRDYAAFGLNYTTAPPGRYPAQLTELACAVDYLKKHADVLNIDPARIFVIGFSAGGHLTGCLANAENIPEMPHLDFRPAGVVLAYPVITARAGHEDSFVNLLGDDYGKNKPAHAWLNLDESVTENNPPAFIWTTASDAGVPAINALLYAAAYAERGLLYELHVFRSGPHGLSLADARTACGNPDYVNAEVAVWTEYADRFLRGIKKVR